MENLKVDLIRLSESLALGCRKLNKDLYNERCIEVVCDTFGVDLHQLFGRTRVRHITSVSYTHLTLPTNREV